MEVKCHLSVVTRMQDEHYFGFTSMYGMFSQIYNNEVGKFCFNFSLPIDNPTDNNLCRIAFSIKSGFYTTQLDPDPLRKLQKHNYD